MEPYYQDELLSLYHADYRDVLPKLQFPDAVVIADPPYGQTSLNWDKWQSDWPDSIPRCIRSMWCFGSMRMFMEHAREFVTGYWNFSHDLVWEKHNGSSFHADRFRRVHESICHFYRGEWSTVPHFIPTTPDATARAVRRKMRPAHMGNIGAASYRSEDGGPRQCRSVIFHRSMHGDAINPTQKPVELVKLLIHYSCPLDGCVISPFARSGTDLIAAREMGRKAIGIEIDESQCERTAKRLSQAILDFSPTESVASA